MKLFRPLMLLLVVSLAGCGGSSIDSRVAALNDSKIKQLYNCYSLFQHHNSFQGPKDEAEFKAFLVQPRYAKNLQRMQIDASNLDDLFVCDRDGEPYVIRYGVNGLGDKAVIFEATGVNGKRMIALAQTQEYDAAEYDAYLSGEKKPAAFDGGQGVQ